MLSLLGSLLPPIVLLNLNLLPQALALLSDYVDKEDPSIRIGAIMGLGITYAGTGNEQVKCPVSFTVDDSGNLLLLVFCNGHGLPCL